MSVGAGPFSGITLMPQPLAQMQMEHPKVRVRLDVTDSRTLLRHLDEESIDFFIAEMRELPERDDCVITKLGWLAGALYVRNGHPLAAKSSLRLSDLKGACFASVHMPEAMKKTLDGLFSSSDSRQLAIALECESTMILRDLALASDTVMLAFPKAVQHDVDAGLLQRLAVQELDAMGIQTPLRTELGLIRLKERTLTPASNIFMQLVRDEAKRKLGGVKPSRTATQPGLERR